MVVFSILAMLLLGVFCIIPVLFITKVGGDNRADLYKLAFK